MHLPVTSYDYGYTASQPLELSSKLALEQAPTIRTRLFTVLSGVGPRCSSEPGMRMNGVPHHMQPVGLSTRNRWPEQ